MAWTEITDNQIETNDWIGTTVVTALCDNEQYNYDHGIRGGTDAVGVRLALARGQAEFVASNEAFALWDGADDFAIVGNIVFSSDSLDGDPKFLSAPNVFYSLYDRLYVTGDETPNWYDDEVTIKEQVVAGGEKWFTSANPITIIKTSGLTKDGFSFQLWFNQAVRKSVSGYVHWVAVGLVSSGE